MPTVKHQLAVIMFTDIVGYTSLMNRDEQIALTVLSNNKKIHKKWLRKFRGKWLKEMGDGILLSFKTTSDAIYCAGAIIREIKELGTWELRIGLNQGEMAIESAEIYGDVVNIASRVENKAQPNQILVTETIYDNIRNKSGVTTRFIGEHNLKNVDTPVNLYDLQIDDNYEIIAPKNNYSRNRFLLIVAAVAVFLLLGYNLFQYSSISSIEKEILSPEEDKSVAVLAFTNLTGDPEKEYLSDGLTEEVINKLTAYGEFKVLSKTSIMAIKGSNLTLPEIVSKLNVRYIIEGSLREFNDEVRITAQFIDGHTDQHIWSRNFDRKKDNIIELHDDVASAIVEEIIPGLVIVRQTDPTTQPTPESYDLYLKGKFFAERFEWNWVIGDYDKASEYLIEAIQVDRSNASAIATLSDLYDSYKNNVSLDGNELRNFSRLRDSLAHLAHKINPNISITNYAMGHTFFSFLPNEEGENLDSAFKYYGQALELSPYELQYIDRIGYFYLWIGLDEVAIQFYEKAQELNPLDAEVQVALGTLVPMTENKEYFYEAINLDSSMIWAKITLLDQLLKERSYDEFDRVFQLFGEMPENLWASTSHFKEKRKRFQFAEEGNMDSAITGPPSIDLYAITGFPSLDFYIYLIMDMEDQAIQVLDSLHREETLPEHMQMQFMLDSLPYLEEIQSNDYAVGLMEELNKKNEVLMRKYGTWGFDFIQSMELREIQ